MEEVVEQFRDFCALLLDVCNMMVGFLFFLPVVMLTKLKDVFHDVKDGRYHLVGHVMQESRLHAVGLLRLTVCCL